MWLVQRVAKQLKCAEEEIDSLTPLSDLGLESTEMMQIVGEIEDIWSIEIPTSLLYDIRTIEGLANYIETGECNNDERIDVLPAKKRMHIRQDVINDEDPVCITGMSARFPGADGIRDFWDLLIKGETISQTVPSERWDSIRLVHANSSHPGTSYTNKIAPVERMTSFDRKYFGLSYHEAFFMDPQQRIALQIARQALDDAGVVRDQHEVLNTGVFIGMMALSQYAIVLREKLGEDALDDPYFSLGTSASVTAGRISYLLNLRGPSLVVDTACSSSLVALDIAIKNIKQGSCRNALVVGVNAVLHPDSLRQGSKMRMLSPSGRCWTFDAKADGFLLGEGCGAVYLERMSDAVRNGHRIDAVILGSAVNQDGRSNGITAPNRSAQVAVINSALTSAGVDPWEVDYVEAHGTGTVLGDTIEIDALSEAYGIKRKSPLYIGAVKTNIGHLAGAAGMAGLIKTVLAMKQGVIPPNRNYETPNPRIHWESRDFALPLNAIPWDAGSESGRVAGISSFGWSGTNSHVLLCDVEAFVTRMSRGGDRGKTSALMELRDKSPVYRSGDTVIPLSAATSSSLIDYAKVLATEIEKNDDQISAISQTLKAYRESLSHRAVVAGDRADDLVQALRELTDADVTDTRASRQRTPYGVFVFPGAGHDNQQSIRILYEAHPGFRQAIDQCIEAGRVVEPEVDVAAILGIRESEKDTSQSTLATLATHLLAFCAGYASAKMWEYDGITPDAVIGYSIGELSAAAWAGVFSIEDGVRLVCERARVLETASDGYMLVAAADYDCLSRIVSYPMGEVVIKAGPHATVVAGSEKMADEAESLIRKAGIAVSRLQTHLPMHSSIIGSEVGSKLRQACAKVSYQDSRVPIFAGLSGKCLKSKKTLGETYWTEHACKPVDFARSVQNAAEAASLSERSLCFFDMGTGEIGSMAMQVVFSRREKATCFRTMRTQMDKIAEDDGIYEESLWRAWVKGFDVDVTERIDVIPYSLPQYRFDEEQLWPSGVSEPASAQSNRASTDGNQIAGSDVELLAPGWTQSESVEIESNRDPEAVVLVGADNELGELVAAALADMLPSRSVVERFMDLSDREDSLSDVIDDAKKRVAANFEAGYASAVRSTVVDIRALQHTTSGRTSQEFEANYLDVRNLCRSVLNCAPLGLLVLTPDAFSSRTGKSIRPSSRAALGPLLCTCQEHPDVICRLVDLEQATVDGVPLEMAARYVAQLVVKEIELPSVGDVSPCVRYEGRRRLVRHLDPLGTGRTARGYDKPDTRQYRNIAIVGGLGRVGRALAGEMLRRHTPQCRVAVIGRLGGRPGDLWTEVERQGTTHAERLRWLDTTNQQYPGLCGIEGDVLDIASIRAALLRARSELGSVDLVIQAAGSTETSEFFLISSDQRDARTNSEAKVYGTNCLLSVLKDDLPGCPVVLMSSISTLLGGLGFSGYIAANAYLEALAESEPTGNRVLAIGWDTWRDTLKPELPQSNASANIRRQHALGTREAMEALFVALASEHRVVMVSAGDMTSRLHDSVRLGISSNARQSVVQLGVSEHRTDPRNTDLSTSSIRNTVRRAWSEALGEDSPSDDVNFFDAGGNSLVGVQLVETISRDFDISVPIASLYESPTISRMTKMIEEKLSKSLDMPAGVKGRYSRSQNMSDPSSEKVAWSLDTSTSDYREQLGCESTPSRTIPNEQQCVAIIGMSCRFPGADSVDEYWRNLVEGVESFSEFPENGSQGGLTRSSVDKGKGRYINRRPILRNIRQWDAEAFGVSPFEASITDPQQRVFLELAWEALESAGYPAHGTDCVTGVFAGSNISTYLLNNLMSNSDVRNKMNDYQVELTNDKDALPLKVSYRLNLTGPSVAVQTFCSTGLVAAHQAIRSLRDRECDMALAGGMSIRVPDHVGYIYQNGSMESADGKVRAFDRRASGTVFGDGGGVVILKRYEDAVRDHDNILAVVRGSAVNNDGAVKAGFTAPSVQGQVEAIQKALQDAQCTADEVGYIEAHGTGTAIGDPIEYEALSRIYGSGRTGRPCVLGSVKPNIGHLDRASGIAGLIKAVQMVRNRTIPPLINFSAPNPHLDSQTVCFDFVVEKSTWVSSGQPMRIAINSLGMGGTNAHMLIEEAPKMQRQPEIDSPHIVTVSATTSDGLLLLLAQLENVLSSSQARLDDIAFTLNHGRDHWSLRAGWVVSSTSELLQELKVAVEAPQSGKEPVPDIDKVVLVLDGGLGGVTAAVEEVLTTPSFVDISGLDAAVQEADRRGMTGVLELIREVMDDPKARRVESQPLGCAERHMLSVLIDYMILDMLVDAGVPLCTVLAAGPGNLAASVYFGQMEWEDVFAYVLDRHPEVSASQTDCGSDQPEDWRRWTYDGDSGWCRDKFDSYNETVDVRTSCATYASDEVDNTARISGTASPEVHQGDSTILTVFPSRDWVGYKRYPLRSGLLAVWLRGADIASSRLLRSDGHRIALPTFPFNRATHWIDAPAFDVEMGHADVADSNVEDPLNEIEQIVRRPWPRWFYEPRWDRVAMLRSTSCRTLEGRRVLLLLPQDRTVAQQIVEDCQRLSGLRPCTVMVGDSTRSLSATDFEVDRNDVVSGLTTTLHSLAVAGEIDDILHCWSYGDAHPHDEELAQGPYSLTAIAAWLATRRAKGNIRVTVLATGGLGQDGDAGGRVPVRAMLAGLLKGMSFELEGCATRYIDVDRYQGDLGAFMTTAWVENETSKPTHLVVRCSEAWNRSWKETTITGSGAECNVDGGNARIECNGGVYLITGGTGGLGIEMAIRLAEGGARKIVLVGRDSANIIEHPDGTWASCDEIQSSRIDRIGSAIQTMRAYGADVEVVSCDIRDKDAVARLFRSESFENLRGIVHAAGVPGGALVQASGQEEYGRVMAAKVLGTLNLLNAVRDLENSDSVQWIVQFASLACITGGGPGQAIYAAANSCMAAIGETYTDLPVKTIFWDEWKWDAWLAADVKVADSAVGRRLSEIRRRVGLSFDEGWAAMVTALKLEARNVIVSTRPLQQLIDASSRMTLSQLLNNNIEQVSGRRKKFSNVDSADLDNTVLEVLRSILGVPSLSLDDDFFDMGGNSLLAIQVAADLSDSYGIELNPGDMYSYRTARDITEWAKKNSSNGYSEVLSVKEGSRRGSARRAARSTRLAQTRADAERKED